MEAERGTIVRCTAGRDKGKFMVVLSAEGDFAMIADGKSRRLAAPKKKRLKHLCFTRTTVGTDELTDKKLRQIIGDYISRKTVPDKHTADSIGI